jgi:molecular chaperone GrpE
MDHAQPGEDAEAQDDELAQGATADADGDAVAEAAEVVSEPLSDEELASDDPDALVAQMVELRQQHARAVADYQNLRRRQAEERRENARLTLKAAVLNYLPVLDDLTRALETVGDHDELADHPWVEGVRNAQRKFQAVIEASGVQTIEAEGEIFDPQLHQALSFQNGPDGRVMGVVQPGYTIDGMVIRPAMVLVGNGEGAEAQQQTQDNAGGSAGDETTDEGTRASGKG